MNRWVQGRRLDHPLLGHFHGGSDVHEHRIHAQESSSVPNQRHGLSQSWSLSLDEFNARIAQLVVENPFFLRSEQNHWDGRVLTAPFLKEFSVSDDGPSAQGQILGASRSRVDPQPRTTRKALPFQPAKSPLLFDLGQEKLISGTRQPRLQTQ